MKDKNNLSRVGLDSRSVRDWIGYCLSLPGKWKLMTSLLLLLTLGIGQVWGATPGDILDINFTDWYNDGGNTEADSVSHYIYAKSSGKHKRSYVGYFVNDGYAGRVAPTSGVYVCMNCSTNTYLKYNSNNTDKKGGISTARTCYTASYNSNGVNDFLITFKLNGPAKIELLFAVDAVSVDTAKYVFTNPDAQASRNAYTFLKDYDKENGTNVLVNENQLQDLSKEIYITQTTTKAGTSTFAINPAKLNNAGGTSGKKIYIHAIRVSSVANYTVTVNPNGGSYASTPTGWTLTDGKYTKSVAGGNFSVPDGLTKTNSAISGWKDNHNNVIAMPFTLTKDTILVAQWAPAYAITYNKGAYGAGDAIAAGVKAQGIDFTLSSEMFTREGYLQVGWTKTDGTSREYMLGGTYSTDAAQAFYPAWGEKETYTAAFVYESESPAAPAGWEFSTGDHTANSNSADYVPTFGSAYPSDGPSDDNFIAFGKGESAYAIYDLGYITTVSKITATLYGGSSSDVSIDIQYLTAKNDATPQYTYTAKAKNWATSHTDAVCTEVVPNVRYIKVKGASKWVVMSAFSVTYGSLVTKYDVTFAKGHEDATGTMSTLRYAADVEVTLPDCGFGAPAETKEFDKWVVTKTTGGASVTVTDGKFTMPSEAVTATATWKDKVVKYAITEGTPENGSVDADVAEAAAGATVTLTATPDEDYVFSAWDVYKTGESTTKVTVTNSAFTMPSYDVTVNATFEADTRAKVLYVTSNSADDTKTSDKLYDALKDTYNVKIVGPTSDATVTSYALVVLHESVSGSNFNATAVAAAKGSAVPVLNTKSYFYNSDRWGWGTPNAGKTIKGCTPNAAYCNITEHPIFAGVISEGFVEITDDAVAKCMQPVGSFASGKEGYTLATTPNNGDGNGCAIHELTPAQRGVGSGKYLMISVLGDVLNALNANGQKLFQNAAAYLIDGTASWTPADPKTVTHTLTNATKASGEDAVCAGVAYSATYEAVSGYTLPATITVKVGGSAIDASNYTWENGVLTIPAAQVTANIEVVVNAEFNCPAAGSGDVVFSWTPKSGSVSTEYIAAGGVDLAPYMESVVGGSITGYAQAIDETTTTLYKNSNNHVYFNGNSAYIKVDLCELAEGDKILVSGQDKNMWVSTSATRPANAEAAAAVLVPGEAFYVPNASALIGLSTIYIFREASFTEVASLTITRSKKFTVTYAASDLTEGAAPAAVDAFDGQKIIVAGQGTMVKGADHFAGWKDGDNNAHAAGDELTVTANMTLTAQWVSCTPLSLAMSGYETTLMAGGATTTVTLDKGASTGTVTWESSDPTILTVADGVITPLKGGTATVTAHVAEDATYCANDITSDEITVNCVVTYNANGGEGTMADATGTTVTIAANGFTYDSHKFLRWNTQPDGLGDDVAVGATVNENKTLYAIWKEVTCTAGANIFSIEFTNTANVNMADGDDDKDMSSYATIVGGSALMSYFRSGSNANVLTYGSSTSKASFGTNAQYLQLNLDCALQKGDVITIANESGNKTAIASGLAADKYPLNGTKESTSSTNSYTVLENDNIENADVLYIGRNTSSGTLTFTAITIYRPLPDASVPTFSAHPADATYGAGDPVAAMTVEADATGDKELHYQWYKENGATDIAVGDDAASYLPTASGEYYCVVTNSPTGYIAQSATSNVATITLVSSDATLAWIKAGDVNIALSDGEYDYEYTLPYNYSAAGAPTVTVGTTDPNATPTVTQATSKNGTATIHVVAQDNVTEKDYSVKFTEYSGCMDAFWFAEEADATANSLTNNTTFFSNMVDDGTGVSATFEVDGTEYTVTRGTSSSSSFGKLTIPAGFNANVYVALKTSGSNRTVTLVPTSGPSYTSANLASSGNHVAEFEDVAAGTYTINVSSGSNFVMVKAHMCKYPVTGVSLPATESVYKDQSITLTPTFTPAEASNKNVTWTTSDASIATVENGVVTGKAAGTVNITVTTEDGGYQAVCAVTVTEIDCDTYVGNLFSLVMKDVAVSNITVGTNEIDMSTYANIASGDAHIAMTSSSKSVPVAYNQNSQVQFCYNSGNLYMRLSLPYCGLKVGDVITITSTENNEFCFTTSATRSTTYSTKNKKYMVQVGDDLVGASEIYVWRASGNNTYLRSISIDRGVSAPFDANRTTLKVNSYGTFCYPQGVAEGMYTGATFYRILEKTGIGFVLEEVRSLQAGRPYMFVAEANTIHVVWNNDAVTAPVNDELNYGLVGAEFDADYTPVPSYYDGHNCYILSNNHIYLCGNNCQIAKYRAYIDYDAVPEAGQGTPANVPAGAPALRRIVVGKDNATAIDNLTEFGNGATATKLIIDGQLYILRGGHIFDATGRLVK